MSVSDKIARGEGYRDSAHRTRVIKGTDINSQGCFPAAMMMVVISTALPALFLRRGGK